jgi:hypothetical protein
VKCARAEGRAARARRKVEMEKCIVASKGKKRGRSRSQLDARSMSACFRLSFFSQTRRASENRNSWKSICNHADSDVLSSGRGILLESSAEI